MKTAQERRELRVRRAARRSRRAANVSLLWSTRRALASNPADRAAVEYDLARTSIRGIRDRAERDEAWARLANLLRTFNGDGQ